jgi:uncharacterized protein with PIN domain
VKELRFLCDEMLGHLARYLRAAGYDTTLAAEGRPDRELLAQAHDEARRFLTLDRRVLEHRRAAGLVVLLAGSTLDEQARELVFRCGVDWLRQPFTRCLIDNAALVPAGEGDRAGLPPEVPLEEALSCPTCGRVYWAGSHHRRMRSRLAAWNAQSRA